MSDFNVMEHVEGSGVQESVVEFVRAHAFMVAIASAVMLVLIVILMIKLSREGLANPTTSLKLMKRDDYGAAERMTNDNAADQSAASSVPDDSCAGAIAEKTKTAFQWQMDVLDEPGQEPMASRPKDDNEFSKVLVGY